jgi:hypothetical protein
VHRLCLDLRSLDQQLVGPGEDSGGDSSYGTKGEWTAEEVDKTRLLVALSGELFAEASRARFGTGSVQTWT